MLKTQRFKVLETNQIFMNWLGVRDYRFDEPQTNEFFTSLLPYYDLFITVSFVFASISYSYIHWPQMDVVIESCIVVLSGSQVSGMFFSFGMKMKEVKAVHLRLQGIIDGEDPESDAYNMYRGVEEKCGRYTKNMAYFIIVNQTMAVVSIFFSIYYVYVGNRDTSNYFLPFRFAVPWNTAGYFGWFMLWFYNLNAGIIYAGVIASVTAYFVCCCFYINGICDHFDLLINSLEEELESNQFETDPVKHQQLSQKVNETICKAIDSQVKALEIFKLVAQVNSGVIFSLLPPNVIFTALTLWNMENANFDIVPFSFLIVCIGCSLFWPFLFCYFASMTTERVARVGETAYGSSWFHYPVPELKKYMVLIVARSQDPVYFDGISLMYCTLEMFGKIMKSSFSYYMIFRSMSQH